MLLDDYGYLPFGLPTLRAAVARMLTESGVPTTAGADPHHRRRPAGHPPARRPAGRPRWRGGHRGSHLHRGPGRHPGRGRLHGARAGRPGRHPRRRPDPLAGQHVTGVPVRRAHVPQPDRRRDARREPTGARRAGGPARPHRGRGPGSRDHRQPADAAAHRQPMRPTRSSPSARCPRVAGAACASAGSGPSHGSSPAWRPARPRSTTAPPPCTQAIAVRMLARGDEFGERAERESRLRREVAAAALREFLPDWRWTMPQGGLSFWVTLPDGDAVTLSRVAAEHGVLVRPGPGSLTPGRLPRPSAHRGGRGARPAPRGHPAPGGGLAGMQAGRVTTAGSGTSRSACSVSAAAGGRPLSCVRRRSPRARGCPSSRAAGRRCSRPR